MSLKRSHASGRPAFGGGDSGGKVDRQDLFDELKRLAGTGQVFTPVDVALTIGASEPQVSKTLLGLAVEGAVEKVDVGRYRATPMGETSLADFVRTFARASKVDSTRQRDLSEITRLKQNNDTMRKRLLVAIAERDHYLSVLRQRGIDPGPVPATEVSVEATSGTAVASPVEAPATVPPPAAAIEARAPQEEPPGPDAMAVPSPSSETPPSGPGDAGGHNA